MKISILGCGWLGLPLAEAIIAEGFAVKGSTTTHEKLPAMADAGVEPYLLYLGTTGLDGDTEGFLANADVLIIDIPPRLKEGDLTEKMRMLIPHIEKSGIRKVLFVSSISVYGKNSGIVTEETLPQPDTENGKQLLEVEGLLQENANFKATILRFGGLIGGERHPVYHLAGRENLTDPDAPINLIHRDDCIGIILAIIQIGIWGEVFNAVAPHHPSRKEYYSGKALELGLQLPQFATENTSGGKTIDPQKIQQGSGYTFRGQI
ncbi:SDR family NAD(P)-dependent oxidoreductase [Flavobacterium sp.]|uniref:SDR family NAD(P)-dependent oxidoreductase n=1 Tax=Flavobacterium sp. TaxID=239 RepID=UPI0040333DB5